jgi:DNA-binding NtrC family response regulator
MKEGGLISGKRVLVVDDEPDVADTVELLLPMCQVVKATSFAEAKEHLENEYFDIAILDIMGVDGYGLLEIANRKKVTAVMLTAHALSPDHVVKSFKEGAASYLPKDEITKIVVFLNDVLEAQKKGMPPWWRWMERLGDFFEKKFGAGWQERDKEFWKKFQSWY